MKLVYRDSSGNITVSEMRSQKYDEKTLVLYDEGCKPEPQTWRRWSRDRETCEEK